MSTSSTITFQGDVENAESATGPVFTEPTSGEEGEGGVTASGSGMPVQDPNPGGGGGTS